MEKLKVKHDHKLTDIIKVCIFALFLILPILCFLPTGLYYGFNEHATAQEETVQEPVYYETNEVNTNSDLQIGNIYYWNDSWVNTNNYSTNDYFDINIDLFTSQFTQFQQYNVYECRMLLSGNNNTNAYVLVNYTGGYNYFAISNKQFNFIITSFLIDKTSIPSDYIACISSSDYLYVKEYQDVTYTMSISKSMYQAWQGLWESPLYNWTNNNNFQFTINAFTNVFGITQQSYITNYLNYLLSLTAVYVVFDIVLAMFKWLTHLIGEK